MEPKEMSQEEKQSAHFLSLLLSLNQSALVVLGKMENPLTHEVGRDLKEAQHTIDLLGMLKAKTTGNLDAKEAQLLDGILADLRLQFVYAAREQPQSNSAENAGEVSPADTPKS